MVRVGCVVLNWNGGDRTLSCLRSIAQSRETDAFLVVVDNGSTDGSLEKIAAEFGGATIIRQARNVGACRGKNIGLAEALAKAARYVLFVDDDAELAPDALCRLVNAIEAEPGVAIAGPRILDATNRSIIWYDGGTSDVFGNPVHRNRGRRVGSAGTAVADVPRYSDFATCCCMLVRSEVFRAVGAFDERLFFYSEDSEFSFRARAAQWRIIHVAEACAFHHQSSDTIKGPGKWYRDYYNTRNNLLLVRRSKTGLARFSGMVGIIATLGIVLPCYFLLTGQWRRVQATYEGFGDFMKGRFGERYT